MKDNFTKKAWVSFAIIFASIVIASVALYYFSNNLTVQANNVIADKQNQTQQDNSLGSLALLKSEEPQAAAYMSAMNQLLPDQYGLIGFGSWLNQIAKKYNVVVSFAFQGNPTLSNGSLPGTIDFSLSVQGPSGSVVNFLHDIESQSPGFLLSLDSFDYTNDLSAGSSAEKVNAQGILFIR